MAMKITPKHFDDLPASTQVPARALANRLDISEVTVWRWSKIGKLPRPRKLGSNTIRFSVGEVRAAFAKLAARAETTMTIEKGHLQAAQNPRSDPSDNTEHSQSWLMLAVFEPKHSMTTIEARREMDILMPAARVFELRAMGYDIATAWTQGVTECGRKHRIAQYVFRKPRHERHWLELYARFSRLGISMCIVLSQLRGLYRYISMLWAG